jgi:tetratricopeptide (TPR) repeat protein
LQHYKVIPYYVLVKFGQWDRILALPKPAADLKYPLAVWHYARGMAYTGKNQLPVAGSELSALRSITRDTTLKNITIWDINSVDKLMAIASLTLEAGMLRKKGDRQAAIVRLGQAVALEDRLNYNEPPDWFFSVRHSLGACLLEDKQFARAEKVYREDLTYQPENGWALHGLLESLRGQNKPAEAKAVESRLREAWQYADITLVGSEVQAVAYQNLNPDSFPGSYLAKLPALPLCGPVKK